MIDTSAVVHAIQSRKAPRLPRFVNRAENRAWRDYRASGSWHSWRTLQSVQDRSNGLLGLGAPAATGAGPFAFAKGA